MDEGKISNYLTNGPETLTGNMGKLPLFSFLPRPEHQILLWITGHMVQHFVTRIRSFNLLDCMDFMRASKWNARQRANGDHLSVCDYGQSREV